MNKTDFRRLFRYSDNCWSLLGKTLVSLPQGSETWNTPFESTSQWNTIRLILAHTIGAEERLVTVRLLNQALPVMYENRAASDLEGLYRDHRTIRAATYAYLDSLTDAAVEEETEVWRVADRSLTRADILFHILNHENYHRGQVVMALQRLGIDPPNFDYVLLKEL
ncbi:MAG: DinB family protein [Armatimonadota bacterium]